MQEKGNRSGEPNRPMQDGGRGQELFVTQIIEQVAAQHEPGKEPEHEAARKAPPKAAPAVEHMRRPERAEQPERGETKRAVRRARPEFERMRARPERRLAQEEVVEKKPGRTRDPKAGGDDVERNPTLKRTRRRSRIAFHRRGTRGRQPCCGS